MTTTNMTLCRTTPCVGCPFWRRAVPAYINMEVRGEAMLALRATHQGEPIACLESRRDDVRFCVGQLIMLKNLGVEIWRPDLGEIVQYVDTDHSVFASLAEFEEHHMP